MRAFTLLVFLLPVLLMAQPFQGQKFVGGSLNFNAQSSDDNSKSFSFSIDPDIGKMISNRFAIGVTLGVSYKQSKSELIFTLPTNGERIVSERFFSEVSLKLEPFVSWYFPIHEKWRFNILAGVGGEASRFKTDISSSITTTTPIIREEYQLSLRISPSIYYFISDKIAFNASFGRLEYRRQFEERQDDFSDLRLSLSSNLAIGVRYFWGKPLEKD